MSVKKTLGSIGTGVFFFIAGSLYERFDALQKFYKLLRKEKVKTVLIPGDVLDGHG